jgi:cell division protease FtsH
MVGEADLQEARDKVLMGVERRSIALSEADRINCAYHEAGHAIVAALLPHADPLHKVTIIPRGRAMGVTMQLPEADRHTYTKAYLETQVAVLMGGRVAEELFMHHMTSGASNDIERATDIAQHMVCEWGMSELGPLAYRKPGNTYEPDRPHAVSEATAQRVDEEIRSIVMNGYDRARSLIERNRESLRMLAEELLQNESLEADEIKAVLSRSGSLTESGDRVAG